MNPQNSKGLLAFGIVIAVAVLALLFVYGGFFPEKEAPATNDVEALEQELEGLDYEELEAELQEIDQDIEEL